MNDTRVDTAIANAHAAIEAMENARRDISELVDEMSDPPAHLTYASVDLGHSIRRVQRTIRELERARETAA